MTWRFESSHWQTKEVGMTADELKEEILKDAESLLEKVEKSMSYFPTDPPAFTKKEVEALKILIAFHN
jgi:hypothetical protein